MGPKCMKEMWTTHLWMKRGLGSSSLSVAVGSHLRASAEKQPAQPSAPVRETHAKEAAVACKEGKPRVSSDTCKLGRMQQLTKVPPAGASLGSLSPPLGTQLSSEAGCVNRGGEEERYLGRAHLPGLLLPCSLQAAA